MADFILARKTRNVTSNMVHIFLNLLLGVGSVLITVLSGSPVLGLLLVIMSKWRIFAVRRRYLWLNIKSNLVDLIVGLSVVMIAYYAGTNFVLIDFILMGFYAIWLLFLKPWSSEIGTMVQSLTSVFFGVTAAATMVMVENMNSIVLVLLAFVIGYAASRHVLVQSSDKDFTLTTLVCGLLFSEIALLCYSWGIVYSFNLVGVKFPQLAIILTIFAFVYNYARRAMIKYQDEFRLKQIIGPVLFGMILVSIVVLWFSNPIFNI